MTTDKIVHTATPQTVLTDDEILAATYFCQTDVGIIRNGRAIEEAVLSRLRAPVAQPALTDDEIDAGIRALKQPRAAKDGGKQGSGDNDVLRFVLEAIQAELDPEWECTSYHPKLYSAVEKLRAALPVTLSEQGERDAG